MYNASSLFLQDILKPSRNLKCKVVIGSVELTEEQVIDFQIENVLSNEGLPGIGGVISSRLTLNMIRDSKTPSYYTNQTIKPYIAIQLTNNGQYEYIPLGVFKPKPDSVEKTDQVITVECEDILTWFEAYEYDSKLSYPASASSVLSEIETLYKLTIVKTGLPTATVKVKPNKNLRVVLGEIAELFGSNLIVNRSGNLEFKKQTANKQTLTDQNYIDFKLLSDNKVSITKLICEKGGQDADGNEIPDIEVGTTTGSTLRLENDSITTTAELQKVFNYAYPVSYWAYEMKCQGMPHFDTGDIFTLVDKKGVSRDLIVLEHILSFNGGLISEFKANATKTEMKAGSTGSNSISNSLSGTQMDVLNVQHILAGNITADNIAANAITADKIDAKAITADKITASVIDAINLNAGKATIDNAVIDVANITTIVAQDIKVGTAQIEDLAVSNAKIGNLAVDTAKIKDASITNAKIKDLSADKITAGDISADRITTGVINAINANIGSATINSAKIGDLSADKITTGTLNADRIGAGTIDANKVNIGDYSNIITVNENIPNSMSPTNFYGGSTLFTEEDGSKSIIKPNISNDYLMLSKRNYMTLKAGQELKLDLQVYNAEATDETVRMVLWCYNSAGGYLGFSHDTGAITVKSKQWNTINTSVKMSSAEAFLSTAFTYVAIYNTKDKNIRFRKCSLLKKSAGELIVDGSITADKITSNAITTDKITAGAITADKIKTNAITTDKIEANAITTDKLQANSITADKIKAGAIVADKISADAINTISLGASKITADKIASGEIKVGNANIVDGTINGAKIASATISEAQIAKATITDASIKELNASKITAGTLDANKVNIKDLKADSITTGSITVLGENLIHNTDFEKTDKWTLNSWKVDSNMLLDGVKSVALTVNASTNTNYYLNHLEYVKASADESFVLTCYVRTPNKDALTGGSGIWLEFIGKKKDGTTTSQFKWFRPSVNDTWERLLYNVRMSADVIETKINIGYQGTQGTLYVAKPMMSRGTIASVWKQHNDELITDGAIDNDKLGDEAVSSSKLMTDELFVGENAFINKLKAVEIDASNITTGKISSERIDINGLVSFEAFDKTLQPMFDVQGDKTYINGGMIATNTIKADKIDLLSGLTVQGPDKTTTFAIRNDGNVEVNGLLQSGNFDEGKNTGYRISPDGTAILNQAKISGDINLPNAGITNYSDSKKYTNLLENTGFWDTTIDPWTTSGTFSVAPYTIQNIGYGFPTDLRLMYFVNKTTTGQATAIIKYDLAKIVKTGVKYSYGHCLWVDKTLRLWVGVYYKDSTGTEKFITLFDKSNYAKANYNKEVFSFTLPSGATNPTLRIYQYGVATSEDRGGVWLVQPQLNEGDSTEWTPCVADNYNPVRIWAGSDYSGRHNANFRVYQNGDLFANNGTFGGRVVGDLDSGKVHIHNDEIVINSSSTFIEDGAVLQSIDTLDMKPNAHIRLGAGQSYINTDLVFGDNNDKRIEYLNSNRLLNLYSTTLNYSKANTELTLDGYSWRGFRLGNNRGTDLAIGYDNSTQWLGTTYLSHSGTRGGGDKDINIRRVDSSNEDIEIQVEGSLTVRTAIKGKGNKIEQRMASDGWGWYSV